MIWQFRDLCDIHHARPVFYKVRAENLPYYMDIGLTAIKLSVLQEGYDAGLSLNRGTLGQNLMYFETGQGSEIAGVFKCGEGVMDRAGADNNQQTGVFTVQNGADGLALAAHLVAKLVAQWQLLFELRGAGQATGRNLGSDSVLYGWQS